jgi:hypothetical protein
MSLYHPLGMIKPHMTVIYNRSDNILYHGDLHFKEARPIPGRSNSYLMGPNVQTKLSILIGATPNVDSMVLFQSIQVEIAVS